MPSITRSFARMGLVPRLYHDLYFLYLTRIKKLQDRFFFFQGKRFNYFCAAYNNTCENERIIEIPIVMEWVSKYKDKDILEVGNVLSHYFNFAHDILDKYELKEGVINQDVVEFHPNKRYDLIISISTLEHVGWDEIPRNPKKIIMAVENIKSLCAPDGKIIVTLPLGYNPELDKLLEGNLIQFDSQYFMKRVSRLNEWKQVPLSEVQGSEFGYPYPYGNAVLIGMIN